MTFGYHYTRNQGLRKEGEGINVTAEALHAGKLTTEQDSQRARFLQTTVTRV